MPNYDYQCDACGHRFEVFQSMKDPKLTDCLQQGCAGPVRRLLGTGAGLIFKGSGFYQTDYRSEAYKSASKSEGEAAKPVAGGAAEGVKPAGAGGGAGA